MRVGINKHISNSRRFFDVYEFILNLNSWSNNFSHVCVCVYITRWINAKSARYVYLIQNRWCSELFTYVTVCVCALNSEFRFKNKTKECACIFPVGWYRAIGGQSRQKYGQSRLNEPLRFRFRQVCVALIKTHPKLSPPPPLGVASVDDLNQDRSN